MKGVCVGVLLVITSILFCQVITKSNQGKTTLLKRSHAKPHRRTDKRKPPTFDNYPVPRYPAGSNLVEQIEDHVDTRMIAFYEFMEQAAPLVEMYGPQAFLIGSARSQDYSGTSVTDTNSYGGLERTIPPSTSADDKTIVNDIGKKRGDYSEDAAHFIGVSVVHNGKSKITVPLGEIDFLSNMAARTHMVTAVFNRNQERFIDVWQIKQAEKILGTKQSAKDYLNTDILDTHKQVIASTVLKFGDVDVSLVDKVKREKDKPGRSRTYQAFSGVLLAALQSETDPKSTRLSSGEGFADEFSKKLRNIRVI